MSEKVRCRQISGQFSDIFKPILVFLRIGDMITLSSAQILAQMDAPPDNSFTDNWLGHACVAEGHAHLTLMIYARGATQTLMACTRSGRPASSSCALVGMTPYWRMKAALASSSRLSSPRVCSFFSFCGPA